VKVFFILLTSFLLTSCAGDVKEYYGHWGTWTPKPLGMRNLPDGPDDYSQGFRDGCNSAISTIGETLLRNYDEMQMDVERNIKYQKYNQGWTNGSNYCTYYIDPDPI
jgi:hypothetical protein